MEAGVITAAFSLATLVISRCRCIIRRSESGITEIAAGFTEHQLLPEKPKPTPPPPE